MKVEIKSLRGPEGQTEFEYCHLEIIFENGERVELEVEGDACSAAWVTRLDHTDRQGEIADLLEGRLEFGRLLERTEAAKQ